MFKIRDGRENFYQWDLDRQLIVDDAAITEVHFCNRTDTCSLVVETYQEDGKTLVNVPNILLQSTWRIHVYAYDTKYTKYEACYEVAARTKPADYVYTEVEIKEWETLKQEVEAGIEETKALLGDIDKALKEIIVLQDEYKGIITFYVEGNEFKTTKDTTWEQFIKDNPNTNMFFEIRGNKVYIWGFNFLVDENGKYIETTDIIQKNASYTNGGYAIEFVVDGDSFYCLYGMTWGEFAEFDNYTWNKEGFSFIDDYVAKNGITLTPQNISGGSYGNTKDSVIGSRYEVMYWAM